jgi:hypothetical protein
MTKPTLQAVEPETKINTPAIDPFDPAIVPQPVVHRNRRSEEVAANGSGPQAK